MTAPACLVAQLLGRLIRPPVLIGQASGDTSGLADTAYNIALPAGVQSDDLVIVTSGWVGSDADPGVATAGYTEISDLFSSDAYSTNLSASYKFMGGAPDAAVTVKAAGTTQRGSAAVLQVWRGVSKSNPFDVPAVNATGINSALADPAAISPITQGAIVITCAGFSMLDYFELNGLTPPSNMNGPSVTRYGDGTDATDLGSFYASMKAHYWSGGAFNPNAWTVSSGDSVGDSWAAVTLALRPLN